MKKTITLSLVFLLTAILNYSFAKASPVSPTSGEPKAIKTLIVNAEVTVVLVDNEKANLEVTGRNSLRSIVAFKEIGDTLVIETTKNRDVRDAGVIYVPANQLRNVRINSEAHVTTFYPLLTPELDVVINGACTVNIASVGKVEMTATPFYTVEQTRDVHSIEAARLARLRYYY